MGKERSTYDSKISGLLQVRWAWLYLLSLLPQAAGAQFLAWQYEDIAIDDRPSGANPSFLQGADNSLHTTYWDKNEDRLIYGKKAGSGDPWKWEIVDESLPAGYKSALALDAQGIIHVCYLVQKNGWAFLRYAFKSSAGWEREDVPTAGDLGVYGVDFTYPVYSQASLDIALTPEGEPLIVFFDASVGKFSPCSTAQSSFGLASGLLNSIQTYNSGYDLYMGIAWKRRQKDWILKEDIDIPYKENSDCLQNGDRFGEFCQLIKGAKGEIFALSNSMHNHQLLLFSVFKDDSIQAKYTVLDSIERFAPVGYTVHSNHQFREAFEYIDAKTTGEHTLHLVYGVSDLYGGGVQTYYLPASSPRRRTFWYARVRLDSLGMKGYKPFYKDLQQRSQASNPASYDGKYRAYFSLLAKSQDTLYISYYNVSDARLLLLTSVNSGKTWTETKLADLTGLSPAPIYSTHDSLFLLAYDPERDYLSQASSDLKALIWSFKPLRPIQKRGGVFSAIISGKVGREDKIWAVYDEEISNNLVVAEKNKDSWQEKILAAGRGKSIAQARIQLDDQKRPWVVYAFRNEPGLYLSTLEAGDIWKTTVIDTVASVSELDFSIAKDSAYILYSNPVINRLLILPLSLQTLTKGKTQLADTTLGLQAFPQIHFDEQGTAHFAFLNVDSFTLLYGTFTPSGERSLEEIVPDFSFLPGSFSLTINQEGKPIIACRDDFSNTIWLIEKDIAGKWTFEPALENANINLGNPLQLITDDKSRPWLLANYLEGSRESLRLFRRDDARKWFEVAVSNNRGAVAANFTLLRAEKDFYIVGKKTNPSNGGVGLLYAQNGVLTLSESTVSNISESTGVFPNPFTDELYLDLQTPAIGIHIFDLAGRRVYERKISYRPNAPILQLDVHHLLPGLYIVKVLTENGSLTRKLMKR